MLSSSKSLYLESIFEMEVARDGFSATINTVFIFSLESCNGLVLKKIKQSFNTIKIATEFVKIEKIITAKMT